MAYNAPGKHFRKGLSHRQFYQMFDEEPEPVNDNGTLYGIN